MSSSRRDEKNQERAIDRTIDETKDSTKKVLQEAKRELTEVTSTFHDTQEENIKAIREMTETYLDSQRKVAKSMLVATRQNSGYPYNWMFWPWANPEFATDIYVKSVSNLADASVGAAKIASELDQIQRDSTHTMISLARENTRILSQYFVETARDFEGESRESSNSLRR